jgi:hypothetical protein
VAATLTPPPKHLGVTQWSSRLLAVRLKVSPATVARAWRAYGIQPWRAESFRFSTDPDLVAKVTDVVGFYLAPPQNAVVLCVDEKSQIQALDRTQPIVPMQSGLIERRSHDYVRYWHLDPVRRTEHRDRAGHRRAQAPPPRPGVPRLPAPGRPRLPRPGTPPGHGQLCRPQDPRIQGLALRIHVHFTPAHASWMNLVEVWFGIAERQAIRRGVFESVKEINAKIRAFIDGWNDRLHPFIWTKTAEEVLAKVNPKQTSKTDH